MVWQKTCLLSIFSFGNQDCVVSMVTRLQTGCTVIHGSFPGSHKTFFFSQKVSRPALGLYLGSYSVGTMGSFCRGNGAWV